MKRTPRRALGRRLLLVISVLAALALPATVAGAEPSTPKRFIVHLEDSVADPAAVATEHSRRFGAEVDFVYRHAIKGYAGIFRGTGASQVAEDSRVRRVELDGTATKSALTQGNATWGLDRIDQRALPLSGTFSYTGAGTGVTAYVVDTGIRFSHSQFGGRAVSGPDYVQNDGRADDCDGHGTHVAGTLGGSSYGVARDVRLVAVRVLDCAGNGTWSGVIAGIDWVTGDHDPGEAAVANVSLGGGASTTVDAAVRGSVADGVSYAIAAGNGNRGGVAQDACKYSPARVSEAMTIGATTKSDQKSSYSNYGVCVDWFAPGDGITSAGMSGDAATATMSGTSMATPHAAGVAALYLQGSPAASPAQVRAALYALTTKGRVSLAKTANNHLLYTNL
ncbi:MAG: S8 family peptidase [Actinomycetota bacterium]|nr:S8 family peptidase [Actinomycetota bacterium]